MGAACFAGIAPAVSLAPETVSARCLSEAVESVHPAILADYTPKSCKPISCRHYGVCNGMKFSDIDDDALMEILKAL